MERTADDQGLVGLQAEAGDEPGRPQHPEGIVGERDLGIEGRPEAAGGQVGQSVVGVDDLQVGPQPEGHGVDGEVPARQVHLDGVAEDDVGLARIGSVGLGPVGGDLDRPPAFRTPTVPQRLPCSQTASAQPPRSSRSRRDGVGGEVDVGVDRRLVEAEDVAHRAADHIETVTGVVEERGQVGGGVDQGLGSRGDHRAEGSAHRATPGGSPTLGGGWRR
jgi:hypothetical protein